MGPRTVTEHPIYDELCAELGVAPLAHIDFFTGWSPEDYRRSLVADMYWRWSSALTPLKPLVITALA